MPGVDGVAHKAGGKLGDIAPLIIGAVLIGAAIYVYSTSSGGSSYAVVGATNNSAERTAANAANIAAQQAQQTNILTGFSSLVGLATQQYNDQTQIALGSQTLQATLAQYTAQQQIARYAQIASQAQSQAYQDAAASAAHASQQNGLWGAISSIFSSGISAFTGGAKTTSNAAPNSGSFGTWG